jgi:hypothetical protein
MRKKTFTNDMFYLHKTEALELKSMKSGYDGAHLQPQHFRGWGRRISSWRPAWVTYPDTPKKQNKTKPNPLNNNNKSKTAQKKFQ